jgi:hypothetical protein
LAPRADQPTTPAKRPDEPVEELGTRAVGSDRLMNAVEQQLLEADARLKAVYGRPWIRGETESSE